MLIAGGLSLYSGEENNHGFTESMIHSLDSVIDRHDILGGTIVSFNDHGIKQYSFGKARLEQNIQWTDSTYFRIASISKFITAIAIMQLMEKGKYNLDTDISTLLNVPFRNSEFPQIPITIRMLLNHTSTIRDSDGAFEFAKRSIYIDTVNNDTVIPAINQLFTQRYLQKKHSFQKQSH